MPATVPPSSKLQRLHAVTDRLKKSFHLSHQNASDWLQSRAIKIEDFRTRSQQLLAATSLAGSLAMRSLPANFPITPNMPAIQKEKAAVRAQIALEEQATVMEKLKSVAMMPAGQLPQPDEKYIEEQLSEILGFGVAAELDGHRLNHTVGIMGGEQHLRRFPTDLLDNHDSYVQAGMAPNRGAFGWFTENGELTSQAIMREKYYFAVQTLYLPEWNSAYKDLKPWYKFRKMVVINPQEQMAVVGVVADAGPAQWVKKQFGGSPEVIREGKIWSKSTRGRIILFFVDDPTDQIPLGPIDLKQKSLQLAQSIQASNTN